MADSTAAAKIGGEDVPASYSKEQIDAMFAELRTDITPVAAVLDTTDDAGISEQLEAARKEGYEQGLAYAEDVQALCELGDAPNQAAEFINRKLKLSDVRRRLAEAKANRRTPVGDAGGSELAEKTDPTDKFRQQFKDGGGQAKLGVTEEQYVASCLTTDTGGVVGS